MIKIGIIGVGYWGPNLARVFNEASGSNLTAVCDANPKRLAFIQQRYPLVKPFENADDMIASDIDAVIIATPLASHYPLALKALNAGKHVFVEKPFTETSAQATELIELAAKLNLVLLVDHTFVYNPAVRRIKQLIDQGDIGKLHYYDSIRINLGLFQPDSNVIWDLAIHDFAIINYLVQEMPVSIAAIGAAHVEGYLENTAFITLQYNSGFIAHINVNWLSPIKLRQILIGGDKKMVMYDDLQVGNRVKVYDSGVDPMEQSDAQYQRRIGYRTADMWAPHIPSIEPLATEAAHFINCIDGKEKPITSGEVGLQVVRMLEATSRSLESNGTPVSITV